MNFMKGYLTYTMAFVAILWAAVGYLAGWVEGPTALEVAWVGLAAFGLRRALK